MARRALWPLDNSPSLTTRRFQTAFPSSAPRHWCPGNPFLTHLLNTYTLLVPGNEAFYIRTLRRCLPRITDATLKQQVSRFMMQEGQHSIGHRRCWTVLSRQGYHFQGFVRFVDLLAYGFAERVLPLRVSAASVACVEHVNAYLGHEFLKQRILRDAAPEFRALFEWHFAEEIEHKGVAFDVLRHVAPSYVIRLIGVLIALPLFYLLMTTGAVILMAQDRSLWRIASWRMAWRHLFSDHHMVIRTIRHVRSYLRPRFHPWQIDNRDLAEDALRRWTANLGTFQNEG